LRGRPKVNLHENALSPFQMRSGASIEAMEGLGRHVHIHRWSAGWPLHTCSYTVLMPPDVSEEASVGSANTSDLGHEESESVGAVN
jgi:hypothetical protein